VPIFIGRGAPVYDFARYDTTLPLVILATPAASPCIIMGARSAFLYSRFSTRLTIASEMT
jgi:hypothetical protein